MCTLLQLFAFLWEKISNHIYIGPLWSAYVHEILWIKKNNNSQNLFGDDIFYCYRVDKILKNGHLVKTSRAHSPTGLWPNSLSRVRFKTCQIFSDPLIFWRMASFYSKFLEFFLERICLTIITVLFSLYHILETCFMWENFAGFKFSSKEKVWLVASGPGNYFNYNVYVVNVIL